MKQITAIINQKGGVGKSTTAHALGAGLMRKGFKVLFVDLDAQGNLSYTMGADQSAPTSLDILAKNASTCEGVQQTPLGDIIAFDSGLAAADMLLTQTGKEYRLKEVLSTIENDYDYIIIDTPPALGILTINALTACTGVIIPAQADIYSLQGIGQLYSTIVAVRQYCNPSLSIDGIILTRHNPRSVLSRDISQLIKDAAVQLKTIVYNTSIRECVALKEAQVSKTDIFSYAPKSNASADYYGFINEYLERGDNR